MRRLGGNEVDKVVFSRQQQMNKVTKLEGKQAGLNKSRKDRTKQPSTTNDETDKEERGDERWGGGTDLVPEVVVPDVARVSQHAAPQAGVHLQPVLKSACSPYNTIKNAPPPDGHKTNG